MRLYNEFERFKKPEILDAAKRGAVFLQKYAKNPSTYKCYLALTRDGKPVRMQKTVFSECFYMMAMSELARGTGEQSFKDEAIKMMDRIVHWLRVDNTDLNLPDYAGIPPTSSLAEPMMLLCLIQQLKDMDPASLDKYGDLPQWCIQQILMHIQRDGKYILENVSPEGKELPGSHGRVMTPGHSIEAGWFLLQYAIQQNDESLKNTAIQKFMINPFEYGWDNEYGGIFYFMDVDGFSPVQLESDMKLWWVHNESMISFLMAYKETGDQAHLDRFAKIFDYSYSHFVDEENGEWYGYLNRQGPVSLSFKGGPWKGCFHVPRCLLMCEKMLKQLCNK